MDLEKIKNAPDGSITDMKTIKEITKYCIDNRNITLAIKIDVNHTYGGLYPHGVERGPEPELTEDYILSELGVTGDVLAIYPYGSQVYGTAGPDSDHDFIIVMKSAILDNGAFRNNAITNEDGTIQGVVYSRGGFIDAINNYEIGALECLSLDSNDVVLSKWPFKMNNWNEKKMVSRVIMKASNSRHTADQQSKNGNKVIGRRGMFHALRILNFGLQLKEHKKIVDFSVCNDLYEEMKLVEPDEFDTRDYYEEFDKLLVKLRK